MGVASTSDAEKANASELRARWCLAVLRVRPPGHVLSVPPTLLQSQSPGPHVSSRLARAGDFFFCGVLVLADGVPWPGLGPAHIR